MNRQEQTKRQHYTGFDYMELVAEGSELSFLLDCYASFGWEMDDYSVSYRDYSHRSGAAPGRTKETLQLKRDRKVLNKTELVRLQRNLEACIRELHRLEAKKTSKATIVALVTGFVGLIFAIGAIISALANPPHIILSIMLTIPALAGCAMSYPLYRRIILEDSIHFEVLIEQKYDEIYAICQRAEKLSYGTQDE